jgi:coenzyme F420-reducing hydrogenase gamma subunit|tara:strand:- start:60 stop:584 length:525 start_codon:yes stop_codon:yes gene_type:complete
MIKGKKGANLLRDFGAILILIVAVGAIFLAMYTKTSSVTKEFGDVQKSILDAYSDVKVTFFSLDKLAKYAEEQTSYDLSKKGGFIEENECGNNFGFVLWNTVDEDNSIIGCYPDQDDINDTFKTLFLANLNEHLESYNEISEIKIPLDNYDDITLRNKLEIVGIAKENIEIPIG